MGGNDRWVDGCHEHVVDDYAAIKPNDCPTQTGYGLLMLVWIVGKVVSRHFKNKHRKKGRERYA